MQIQNHFLWQSDYSKAQKSLPGHLVYVVKFSFASFANIVLHLSSSLSSLLPSACKQRDVKKRYMGSMVARKSSSARNTIFLWQSDYSVAIRFESREVEFGISNIQIDLTTLEEVFLKIAEAAEQDTPMAAVSMFCSCISCLPHSIYSGNTCITYATKLCNIW